MEFHELMFTFFNENNWLTQFHVQKVFLRDHERRSARAVAYPVEGGTSRVVQVLPWTVYLPKTWTRIKNITFTHPSEYQRYQISPFTFPVFAHNSNIYQMTLIFQKRVGALTAFLDWLSSQ